jgi:hypothetical protein
MLEEKILVEPCDYCGDGPNIQALYRENAELREKAAFGEQCYQDRCKGAYVEASVVKRLEAERAALLVENEKLKVQNEEYEREYLTACVKELDAEYEQSLKRK